MAIAFDVSFDVASRIGGRCSDIAIVAGMADYPLGNQRSSIPQLGAVCLAADYHTFDWIYHDAILDVPSRISLLST